MVVYKGFVLYVDEKNKVIKVRGKIENAEERPIRLSLFKLLRKYEDKIKEKAEKLEEAKSRLIKTVRNTMPKINRIAMIVQLNEEGEPVTVEANGKTYVRVLRIDLENERIYSRLVTPEKAENYNVAVGALGEAVNSYINTLKEATIKIEVE